MRAAWTGGQYSLVRFAIAITLAWTLASSSAAGLAAAALSLSVAVGFRDRTTARLLALFLATGVGRCALDPASRWFAIAWLLAHAALPTAPYGSVAALGREDAGGGWAMTRWFPAAGVALFVAARLTFGVRASMEGELPLAIALTLLGLLATSQRTLATAWVLSLGLELGRVLAGGEATPGAWIVHLLAMQPAWMPPREQRGVQTVFYDGSCALCHGAVRFLLAEDVEPPRFRLATLGGDVFAARVPPEGRVQLPDSLVLVDDRGRVHTRSDAVVRILDDIGGLWRPLAFLLDAVPRGLRDAGYDLVAGRRHAWFGRKDPACVLVPPSLRGRFDHDLTEKPRAGSDGLLS